MSCDMDCDVTLKEDAVRASFTAIDARWRFHRNSFIRRIFIATRRCGSTFRLTAVNRGNDEAKRASVLCLDGTPRINGRGRVRTSSGRCGLGSQRSEHGGRGDEVKVA